MPGGDWIITAIFLCHLSSPLWPLILVPVMSCLHSYNLSIIVSFSLESCIVLDSVNCHSLYMSKTIVVFVEWLSLTELLGSTSWLIFVFYFLQSINLCNLLWPTHFYCKNSFLRTANLYTLMLSAEVFNPSCLWLPLMTDLRDCCSALLNHWQCLHHSTITIL